MSSTVQEIDRVVGCPTIEASSDQGWSNLSVRRMAHPGFEGRNAPMPEHVVVGYLNKPVRIERRIERVHRESLARHGSLTTIPARWETRVHVHAPVEVIHVYISPERLGAMAEENGLGRDAAELSDRLAVPDPTGAQLLALLAGELHKTGPTDLLFAEHLSELFCLHMLRQHSRSSKAVEPPPRVGGMSPRRLKRVLDHVMGHLDGPIRLGDLVAEAGLSRTHFLRTFKQATGLAPHQFVTERRIEKAKALLDTTDLPVIEVGMRSGYDRPDHFASVFRRVTGVSPREWRRQRRA